jgi:hypothetical protein
MTMEKGQIHDIISTIQQNAPIRITVWSTVHVANLIPQLVILLPSFEGLKFHGNTKKGLMGMLILFQSQILDFEQECKI